MKTAIIPVNANDDLYVFEATVRKAVAISSLEPMLFPKLLSSLATHHPSDAISIWGVDAGEKSKNANQWNSLESGDVAIFTNGSAIRGVARIESKFQSETVAKALWPQLISTPTRQYLLTLSKLISIEHDIQSNLTKKFKQLKIGLLEFSVYEDKDLNEFISALEMFQDASLLDNNLLTFESAITRVLDLQKDFTSTNTAPMKERGEIIRNIVPSMLRSKILDEARRLTEIVDLDISGNDGVGLKAEIPYIRIFSKEFSPRPTSGWYLVLLFDASGEGFYLSLCHASTKNVSDDSGAVQFVPRSAKEIASLLSWAESRLGKILHEIPNSVRKINLNATRSTLGSAYESTTLVATYYPSIDIPSLAQLETDIFTFLPLLKELYVAQASDPTQPGEPTPEYVAAIESIEMQSGGKTLKRGKRQGFGLSAIERMAVEKRAVSLAIEYYKSLGYSKVEDVGAVESYDLKVVTENGILYVEVKGTTSHGESVILTRNEVALHKKVHPSNALFIVSHIDLIRGEAPLASEGICRVISPWEINLEDLNPLGFEYDVPT